LKIEILFNPIFVVNSKDSSVPMSVPGPVTQKPTRFNGLWFYTSIVKPQHGLWFYCLSCNPVIRTVLLYKANYLLVDPILVLTVVLSHSRHANAKNDVKNYQGPTTF
jgi:hypothetical protein